MVNEHVTQRIKLQMCIPFHTKREFFYIYHLYITLVNVIILRKISLDIYVKKTARNIC